jgi:hypothetical protein
MKEIDLQELLPPLVLRYSRATPCPGIFLTIPPCLPRFSWQDDSLEHLIRSLLDLLIGLNQTGMPLRLSVSRRLLCTDLDDLLGFRPACRIEFRIEIQSLADSWITIRGLPEKHGFLYGDIWERDSNHRLIFYTCKTGSGTAFYLWIEMHKGSGKYTLMIPVPV